MPDPKEPEVIVDPAEEVKKMSPYSNPNVRQCDPLVNIASIDTGSLLDDAVGLLSDFLESIGLGDLAGDLLKDAVGGVAGQVEIPDLLPGQCPQGYCCG